MSINSTNLSNSMNAFENLREEVSSSLHLQEILVNGSFAILILVLGIFIGKFISIFLKKIFSKLDIQKHIKGSLVDLIIVVIRWAIYLVFLHIALKQLGIPLINSLFGSALITIPAVIASIALLSIGFAVAIFLKSIVVETSPKKGELFSNILFYFVLYLFGVYSIKIALITLESHISDYIIIALTLALPIVISILCKKQNSN
ncbi:MAG: hypothetical protein ACOCUU_02815 [Nanoarchaeota archaeon]